MFSSMVLGVVKAALGSEGVGKGGLLHTYLNFIELNGWMRVALQGTCLTQYAKNCPAQNSTVDKLVI